jgi:hypothetical protein
MRAIFDHFPFSTAFFEQCCCESLILHSISLNSRFNEKQNNGI